MFQFTPITVVVLATAFQGSTGVPGSGTPDTSVSKASVSSSSAPSTAAPGATTASSAERLALALAEWELRAATSGEDAEVAAALEALAAEASAAQADAPADAAIARAAEAVEASRARFRAERGLERPAAQQPGQEPSEARANDEQVIMTAIMNHLHAGPSADRQEAILRFGSRAVPALVTSAHSMSAANALGAPAIALDTLAIIAPLKALEVSWELSAQPSFLVRQVIAEVLSRRMVYSRDDVWVAQASGDHIPAVPEWGQLVERLLGEPAVAPKDLRNVLAACATRGHAPQAVIDAILSLEQIQDWPQLGIVPPGARALYIAGLQHRRVDIRRHCAGQVRLFPDVTPLFALHSDEDVPVRSTVAQALGERDIAQRGPTPGSATYTKVPPRPDASYLEALEHCLTDENATVRQSAVSAMRQAYYSLMVPLMPPTDLARLFQRASHVDVKLPLLQMLSLSAPELMSGAAQHALSDPAFRASEKTYGEAFAALGYGMGSAEHAPTIASEILAALEAHATPKEWGVLLDRDLNDPPPLLVHLPEELRVRLVRRLALSNPNAAWRLWLWWGRMPHECAPWRSLVLDASAPVRARAVAILWSLDWTPPSPEHLAAIVGVTKGAIRDFSAPDQSVEKSDAELLTRWIGEIVGQLGNRGVAPAHLLCPLFADRSVPDSVLLMLQLNTTNARGDVARAVLERFPFDSWERVGDYSMFSTVLSVAHTLEPNERVPLIEGTLRSQNQRLWPWAINAAGRCRDVELIEVLRRFGLNNDGGDHSITIANSAASFLSDDAAKLILELAARTSNAEVRAAVLGSLQQVIDYQTALANWQQRSDASAVRMRAIADLVALIDDASVPEAQRVEAVRGLALLGAVEELPRLVRTLTAPSPALQAAAREALDRLNATPVK